jgi:hypothetical protein
MMARVVLPRVIDPQTGQPLTTVIQGDTYTQVGRWQQLAINDVPRMLARQIRVLRSKIGPEVDSNEAYVDQLILNVYSGKGTSTTWIDDLTIEGHVAVPLDQRVPPESPADAVKRSSLTDRPVGTRPDRVAAARVELHGTVLTADGRALAPRIIEYQGEPLNRLGMLGFSGIHLSSPTTSGLLDEADRLGLWLVCPPPDVTAGRPIPAQYSPVLCWDLGWGLSRQHLTATRHLTDDLRRADPQPGRPVICGPHSDLRSYSRYADILLLDRSPLGTSLDLSDYGAWLERRPLLARPGTPAWAVIQTEPAVDIVHQMSALSDGRRPSVGVQLEQIRLLAYTAISAGARGLVFTSRTRLDTPEPVQEMRAEMLELINLELSLIDPWAAGGERAGVANSSDPQVGVSVLATERARLMIAARHADHDQYAAVAETGKEVYFVVPGVPESHSAYHLTTTGLRPLRHKRVTGGMWVNLPNFSHTALIVLTQDSLVINELARRVAATSTRAAQLSHRLAERRLVLTRNVVGAGQRAGQAVASAQQLLSQARSHLQHSEQLLEAGDAHGARESAERALVTLSQLQRACWENGPSEFDSPVTNPFRAHFATLPFSWSFANEVRYAQLSPNLLPGGDFENLDELVRSGWQHLRHHDETVISDAELSPLDRRSGRTALRLRAFPASAEAPPQTIETPPVWVHSAPVQLRQGQVVRIHGWVTVRQPIEGSPDGLMIYDSLSGEPLATRVREARDWTEFVLYRAADQDAPMILTFALTGLGEAWLDNVTVSVVKQSGMQAFHKTGASR